MKKIPMAANRFAKQKVCGSHYTATVHTQPVGFSLQIPSASHSCPSRGLQHQEQIHFSSVNCALRFLMQLDSREKPAREHPHQTEDDSIFLRQLLGSKAQIPKGREVQRISRPDGAGTSWNTARDTPSCLQKDLSLSCKNRRCVSTLQTWFHMKRRWYNVKLSALHS